MYTTIIPYVNMVHLLAFNLYHMGTEDIKTHTTGLPTGLQLWG
jgi:hypothetical protein